VNSAVASLLVELRSYSEIGDSQQGRKKMKTVEFAAMEAVTRQRLVKT
jgi:hypothetical protein